MRFRMSRMNRHRITGKLVSIGLAMAVTMSLMPISVGSVYAEEDGLDYRAVAEDLAAVEDVAAAEDEAVEEYTDPGEDVAVELPDDADIESVDIETEDYAASGEVLAPEELLDYSVDEDASLEEDGILEDEGAAVYAEETEADIMLDASGEVMPETTDSDEENTGGNVERLYIPSVFEKMGVSLDESSADAKGLLYAAGNTDFNYAGYIPSDKYNLTITSSGNMAVINGTISSPWSAAAVYVDGVQVSELSGTVRKFTNYSFNLSSYVGTGYHTVMVVVRYKKTDGSYTVDLVGKKRMICNTITDRPNSNGVFDVYSSYFNYYPYGSFGNLAGNLYMEYSANGGRSWQRSGYMKYNMITTASSQGYKIGGLRAKTTYRTRIRYGTYATYLKDNGGDGKSYFFGGPVLNTTTIKTGSSSKPKIKSVTLKATKVKYHKLRWPGYYNVVGGSVFWHNSYVEKFYTAKVKVTVKLKKKPGTNGVFISLLGQTKWKKGNKKKYTVTFTPTYNYWVKNPRSGKYKLQVQVYSGQNSSWGGYSPVYSKKKKVR